MERLTRIDTLDGADDYGYVELPQKQPIGFELIKETLSYLPPENLAFNQTEIAEDICMDPGDFTRILEYLERMQVISFDRTGDMVAITHKNPAVCTWGDYRKTFQLKSHIDLIVE